MPRMAPDARRERRRQFIDAASRCLSDRSYRDLTVDDVCAEAGLSKGSFYTHFDGKRDLLLALLEDDADAVSGVLEDLADGPDGQAPEVVKRLLRRLLKEAEDPARRQVRADLWAAAAADDELRARLGAGIADRRRRLAAWVEAAAERGELRDIPANAFAAVLLALADGLALHASADPGGFRWTNISRAVETLVDGLAPDRTHRPRPSVPR
jgi:AcrR family transcriptional regulator